MKTHSLLAALILVPAFAFAQQARTALPPIPPDLPPPVLIIREPGKKDQQLDVKELKLDIKVRGHLATTTYDLTFFNPNDRILEGELVFPLGEGQTVSGYALEVNGKMRLGVVVEKEKGREVFEEVVRRGIDPGLAEITKGNAFRTRVYPLPPRGTKRVSISFEQELQSDGGGYRYHLPLAFKERIEKFSASAEVVRQEIAPVVDESALDGITFEKWRESFRAELSRENFKADKPLAFRIPRAADQPDVFMVADKLEPRQLHFSLRVNPEIPVAPVLAAPKKIALFYDASGSAEERDRKKEFAFFDAWFKALGDVSVSLTIFRNDADKPVSYDVKGGDWKELKAALEDTPLDGGTSLGAIDVAAGDADVALLMSDGMTNFGRAEPKLPSKESGRAVFAAHASQIKDTSRLERIAHSTGGRVLNLITMQTDDAVQAMRSQPFQFLGAKVISGSASEMYPSLAVAVTNGFTLAGRCDGKTEIELSFGFGSTASITRRLLIDPNQALDNADGDFIRRVWAQKKIAELDLDPEKNAAAITALGVEHRVVTSNTSLIVLDRIEDYVRHHIVPPEDDLRKQYDTMLAAQGKQPRNRADDDAHMREVLAMWKDFKDWHGKRHPWLETVLVPCAKREVTLMGQLVKRDQKKTAETAAKSLAEAETLSEKADDLQKRWKKDAIEDDTRASWEKEAIEAMLALDTLRQARLKAWPESENLENKEGGNGRDRLRSLDEITAGRRPQLRAMSPADPFSADSVPRPAPAAPPASAMPVRRTAGSPRPIAAEVGVPIEASQTLAKSATTSTTPLQGGITIKPWDPQTPYLKKLRKAGDDAYKAYLKERGDNADSSAFFLDVADFFREERKDDRLALRVLSNLAEMQTESAPLVRILAYRLQQLGRHDLAVPLFEDALKLRGEEPQSYRDLALALSMQKKPEWKRAADLLCSVVKRRWDSRFNGIELIALHELNALLKRVPNDSPKSERPDPEALGMSAELYVNVPADLRVVLSWDADNTDMDLWVIDPTGEVCIYNHNRTQTGGHMTNDFTGGYGPEVFTVRRALPGTYQVKVNYFGDRQQKLTGATTVQLKFQTAFGSVKTKTEAITVRLSDKKETIAVGSFVFRP